MVMATITSKGQTTIPAAVRGFLGLHAGDKLEFIMQEKGRVLLVPATIDVSELKGILPKPKKSVSLRDIKSTIKKRAADKYEGS